MCMAEKLVVIKSTFSLCASATDQGGDCLRGEGSVDQEHEYFWLHDHPDSGD